MPVPSVDPRWSPSGTALELPGLRAPHRRGLRGVAAQARGRAGARWCGRCRGARQGPTGIGFL